MTSFLPSRRALVARLATIPVAAIPAAASPDAEIEALFSEWLAIQARFEQPMTEEEESEDANSLSSRLYSRLTALEVAVWAAPSSLMKLAAAALIEMAAMIVSMKGPWRAPLDPREGDGLWMTIEAIRTLRPHLTGNVARCAADLLDNPGRPLGESALFGRIA